MGKCKRTDFIELSKEVLDKGGCLRFRAGGGSMHPFVRDGDFLVVTFNLFVGNGIGPEIGIPALLAISLILLILMALKPICMYNTVIDIWKS